MRRLKTNNHADIKMIGMVVAIFVTLIVSILVLYAIASGTTFSSTLEQKINENRGYSRTVAGNKDGYNNSTSAGNATTDILNQAGTFFQIAPIIGIVLVAVVILTYVGKIGGATV